MRKKASRLDRAICASFASSGCAGRDARADVWMLPMRQPIVDRKGRLRLGYFKANERLQKVVKRQNFEVVLQAKVGAKVLARERIAPYRKDVLVKSGKNVGGGDVTRKRKLLEKQKKGKARAKSVGRVELSQEAFWSVIAPE